MAVSRGAGLQSVGPPSSKTAVQVWLHSPPCVNLSFNFFNLGLEENLIVLKRQSVLKVR